MADCKDEVEIDMSMPILNNSSLLKAQNSPDTSKWRDEKRADDAKFDILILAQAELISKSELLSLYKMIQSPDRENLTVAEEVIKAKFNTTEHDTIQSKE